MRNLLHEPVSKQELTRIFADAPPSPLLPPMGDWAWDRVAANPVARAWLAEIRARSLNECLTPLPVLTDELYADFHRSGIRLRFERLYFERRRLVARAAIGALTEPEAATRERLLCSMLAKLEDIFNEVSWSLPAHVGDVSGKDPMTIDLFAAETANLFGEMLNLFGRAIAPQRCRAIELRLEEQFFHNYLRNKPHWATISNNWNAVCHQGVLGAALAVCEDPELLSDLFLHAVPGLEIFLSGFGADGGSSEGPGYWGYGFGWMAELNRQLEQRTGGQLSLFESDSHIRAIAAFGPRMTLTNALAVNFSDNVPHTAPRPALLSYLAQRLNDSFIGEHAAVAWQWAAARPLALEVERADVFFLTRHLLRCPEDIGPPSHLSATDTLLPDLGIVVLRFHDNRGRLWEFACKAGHNDEHHNHNDLGSYLLNIDGHRLLIEIGAPEYVKDFFGPPRYTFLAARSLGHPVPLINHQEQAPGIEFRSSITACELAPAHAYIEMDLTAAYPSAAGCTRLVRRFEIDKNAGRITIRDEFKLTTADDIESVLITESDPLLQDGLVGLPSGAAILRVTPGEHTQVSEIQKLGYQDHDGRPQEVRRIVLIPKVLDSAVTMEYIIELVAVWKPRGGHCP